MMRAMWALARVDLKRWRRSPVLIAAALVPALGMALMVIALTYAVGRQPVALVSDGEGPLTDQLVDIIRGSDGFFLVERTAEEANADLAAQRVAAVITIPDDFDQAAASGRADFDVVINNVDMDFADDIRRSVNEAAVEIDAPSIAPLGESDLPPGTLSGIPNPYRVDVAETDLRRPDVGFIDYQLVSALVLLAISAGTLVPALALAGERERGLLDLLALSPPARATLIGGRLLGGTVTALAVMLAAVIPAVALGWLHPPTFARWPALAALLAATAAAAVGLGVIVGSITRRVTSTVLLGVNAAAALFLLGGGFTTVAFLPDTVQAIARAIPTTYAVEGVREVLFYRDTPNLGRNLVILVGTAIGGLAIGATTLAVRRR